MRSKNEHVGKIERKIHHVKQRCGAIKANMNIIIILNSIINAFVSHAVIFMNAFHNEQEVFQDFLPWEPLTIVAVATQLQMPLQSPVWSLLSGQ